MVGVFDNTQYEILCSKTSQVMLQTSLTAYRRVEASRHEALEVVRQDVVASRIAGAVFGTKRSAVNAVYRSATRITSPAGHTMGAVDGKRSDQRERDSQELKNPHCS
jgi:hypothetical protein